MVKIDKPWKVGIAVAVATSAVVFVAAILDGWSALTLVFMREGVYLELCKEGEQRCEAQELRLSLVFTVGTVVIQASSLPVGLFLDRYGPRKTTLLGILTLLVGFVLLGFSNSETLDLYIPGFAVICIGGPCLYYSTMVIGVQLWPARPATVTSILTSANDMSTAVFLVFEVINLYTGLPSSKFFFIYLCIPGLLLMFTLFLWPTVDEAAANPVEAARVRRASLDLGSQTNAQRMRNAFRTLRRVRMSHPRPSQQAPTPPETRTGGANDDSDVDSAESAKKTPPRVVLTQKKLVKVRSTRSRRGSSALDGPLRINSRGALLMPDWDPSSTAPVDSSESSSSYETEFYDVDELKSKKERRKSLASSLTRLDIKQVVAEIEQPKDIVISPRSGRVIFKTTTKSVSEQIRSPEYWSIFCWVSVTILFTNFYLSTIPAQISQYTDNQDTVAALTRVFGIILPMSLFVSPIIGFLLDRRGHVTALLVVQLTLLVKCILQFVPVAGVQVLTFVAFTVFRSFLYSTYIALLIDVFGRAHFGRLFGTQMLLIAIVNTLVYVLAYLTIDLFDGDFTLAYVCELVVCVLGFAFPAYWRFQQAKHHLTERDLDEIEERERRESFSKEMTEGLQAAHDDDGGSRRFSSSEAKQASRGLKTSIRSSPLADHSTSSLSRTPPRHSSRRKSAPK